MSLLRDASLSAIAAGFVTVLVGYTSSVALIFQATQALGATPAQVTSWLWALGIGMGVTCIGLSLRYRVPVATAWSTPGSAMLITAVAGVPMGEAIGAFVVAALLMAVCGFAGLFERVTRHIPVPVASAMLAGVLLRFGLDAFRSMQTQWWLCFGMFATYLAMRRFSPRYAVVVTLVVAVAIAAAQGLLRTEHVRLAVAVPEFVMPQFSFGALLGIALPLFVVTMASQNMTGVAVMRAAGYQPPLSPVLGWVGAVNVMLAPFGAFSLGLAAITAAICMSPEAHEDPQRRYVAAVSAGFFYLLAGIFGATVAGVMAAFPMELVVTLAGLALLGTIGNGLVAALANEGEREAALITFLVTASGLSLLGIGSAFWGLLAGVLVRGVLTFRKA
ncbi:benzoate/H(+) symporter BenE family transporter [Uliginosibacterium sp. H1]|uniref:benzoate/H(+) symporter BenE family transporter n=1 Tax=Uliginosibacterium sp. H1 TaxID=3114757 RepID=UPI002E18BBE2|nr:benzoate/H(+) symporter BenE family transporter [Uliginosibacterium sp. H1]